MISQHIVSTGAAFLVLSAHLGTSDLEIGIGGHDVDRDSLMTAVAISCAKNRLLIDFLRDVEGYASGPMLLHGAALRQVFYADEPSSAANFSLGITSKATQSFSWINKHSDVTFAVDSGGGIEFCGKYHREALLRRLIDQIKHVASELATAGPEAVVGDISLISPREKEVLRTRNMGPIAGQQQCLHAVVLQIACSFPEKTAIAARDNSFLYRDVDAKSALMAHKLIDRGITPGAIVPVCLEKSGIVPIVMMAVMRAGAAFLPLDPSNPDERLGHILTESRATLVVTSRTNAGRMNSLGCKVYMVDDDPKPFECGDDAKPLPTVVPSDLAYVIYTSGSTGKPKGAMIQHSAISTSLSAWTEIAGLSSSCRMLQILSYAFDASVAEIFLPLIRGGTVCIPSEEERFNKVGSAITDLECNWAFITPSLARAIPRRYLCNLHALSLGGEEVTRDDITNRFAFVPTLITSYGPTETAVVSSAKIHCKESAVATGDIGYAVGSRSWIVDPDDITRLMPLGAIGELLIEGPTVGMGYLNDRLRTEDAFCPSVNFLGEDKSMATRCYKTGDLVRLTQKGTMQFVRRKDDQVKVRGHRLELGEVEAVLRTCFDSASDCVVLLAGGPTYVQHLVACVCRRQYDAGYPCLHPAPESLRCKMQNSLPEYMIPSMLMEINEVPLTVSGKIDRKALTLQATELLHSILQVPNGSSATWTPQEDLLRELWANQLGIILHSPHQNVFTAGGDSLKVIQFIHCLWEKGLSLTAIQVFENPTVSAMAAQLGVSTSSQSLSAPEPFSLVPREGEAMSELVQAIPEADSIQDAFPCSPIQVGLMAASLHHDGVYVIRTTLTPCIPLEANALCHAWDLTVDQLPILRTRIVNTSSGFVQVVIRRDGPACSVYATGEKQDHMQSDRAKMGLNTGLFRISVMVNGGEAVEMQITAHHAICDEWMLKQVLTRLSSNYRQREAIEHIPFSAFIQHLKMSETAPSKDFWESRLNGATAPSYPESRSSLLYQPRTTAVRTIPMPARSSNRARVTAATLAEAAWALLMSKYSDTTDVTFAMTVNGRTGTLPSMPLVNGPTLATVPSRVRLPGPSETIDEFLYQVQSNTISALPHAHLGVQNISKVSADAANACAFRSLLVVQTELEPSDPEHEIFSNVPGSTRVSLDYPLVLEVVLSSRQPELRASLDENILSPTQADRLLRQMEYLITQLELAGPESHLGDLDFVRPSDLAQIQTWNECTAPPTMACIHETFSERTGHHPEKEAICSWDGQLTFRELEEKSSQLANSLLSRGIQRGQLVPLCFEKSMWAIVSMLAVMKTGAAFVSLDPNYPKDRLSFIIQQTEAQVVLGNASTIGRVDGLVEHQLTIDASWFETHDGISTSITPRPTVGPSDTAFLLFTSGSTGRPKGIIISHSNFSSSMRGHGPVLGIGPDSRVLQFCAFTCDVSMGEVWTTLTTGGTLCIPSEYQRMNDLAATIRKFNVTWTFQTPTVAAHLDPDEVGDLQTLVYGSETASPESIASWAERVRLVNSYGPAETCIWATAQPGISATHRGSNIGFGLRCGLWVTEPGNQSKLVPIGAIGQLSVEGPNLASGYFKDEAKTAAAFYENPPWAKNGESTRRFYDTGDLVRYNENGSIEFLGRKDTQVKIRGLRVELGEVEYQIRRSLQQDQNIAVEMVKAAHGTAAPALAAFVCTSTKFSEEKENATSLIQTKPDDSFTYAIPALRRDLESNLPHHMVPTAFVPLQRMPLSTTGKTDRKALKDLIAGLSTAEFAAFSIEEGNLRPPQTKMQRALHELWCSLLRLPAAAVGMDTHWFRSGGDSVLAMQLMKLARGRGLAITVNDVFEHPTLEDLAALISDGSPDKDFHQLAPFELLRDITASDLLQEVHGRYGIKPASVQDLYPCTPFQEGLMALSAKQPKAYVAQFVFRVPSSVDSSALHSSWEVVAEGNAILRTRIVDTSRGTMQAVLDEPLQWSEPAVSCLETYLQEDQSASLGYGQQLNRYALVSVGQEHFLVWTTHHALYDGHSMPRILESVEAIYQGETAPDHVQYNVFVDHLSKRNQQESQDYWRAQLAHSQPPNFFLLPSGKEPHPSQQARQMLPLCKRTGADITTATLLRAAWACLVGSYSGTSDVVFGSTVSGRMSPLAGIDLVSGPTVATVPVRVRYDPGCSVADYLRSVQYQASSMVPYEHDGLQNIKDWCPDDAASMAFQNLFIVQTQSPLKQTTKRLGLQPLSADLSEFLTYAINVECTLQSDEVEVVVHYDPSAMDSGQMRRVLAQFKHLVQQMASAPDHQQLQDLQTVSPADLKDLQRWNQDLIEPCAWTLHDIVSQKAKIYSKRQAIVASDGTLSYEGLDDLSTKLAYRLMSQGFQKGDRVLLCYNKSCSAVIATLAILKSGGTVVPINPQHPESRLKTIVGQARARAAVCTERYSRLCQMLTPCTVAFDDFIQFNASVEELPTVSPADEAFVYFTSGSSGVPKGVVLEHGQLGTSLIGQAAAWGTKETCRFLQFSSLAYDAYVAEVWGAFLAGACLCMPSDHDRMNDLTGACRAMRITTACLTPTVARSLEFSKIPTFETLVIIGEPLTRADMENWANRVQLFSVYGITEASLGTSRTAQLSPSSPSNMLGNPYSGAFWVVDIDDSNRLAPVGAVGELIIESPSIARGYLDTTTLGDKSPFIRCPDWLEVMFPGRSDRVYKSGDLVRNTSDNALEYIARKDTVTKINGQRIDLVDIQDCLKRELPRTVNAAVEVVQLDQGTPTLAAFLAWKDTGAIHCGVLKDTDESTRLMLLGFKLARALHQKLPRHSVPSVFIPLTHIPVVLSGKLDRQRLKELASRISPDDVALFQRDTTARRPPTSTISQIIARIWAGLLRCALESISMDDHFFHMGGDSVKSMRLVSQLHKEGYTLTVDQIFHHPTLGEMADMAEQSSDPLGDVKPFQLIPTGKHADLMNEAARQCQCQIADITDIYPATPVQEGLMAASTDGTGAYVSNLAWTVPSHIDVARLQQALKAVIETSDILRTRLFHTEDGLMQCIQGPAEPVPITRSDQSPLDLAAHLSKHQSPMGLGQRLIAFNIIEGSSDRYLTMTAHHSVYDGWMAPQMFHNIEAAYFGEALVPSTPFRRFVAHIQSGNEKASEAYWKRAMEGANIPDFPEYPRADYQARTSARVTYCMRPAETPRGVTLASVIRAAWALLLGKHTGSQDVVFGVTMTGRGASMPGIESVDGPCINTTPTRLWFEPSETVSSYLERVHQEGMDAVPHEQLGLQHIRKLSVDCAACCEMRTTLVVQTGNIVAGKRLGLEEVSLDGRQIHNQAINLQCILGEDDIVFDVNYDENVLSERQMLRILQQLEHFIYQMTTAETSTILRDLSGASPSDVDEIRHWNSYMPPERNILMHDLIARKVAATPEKTAIDAWDGCFTYTQFDLAATKLAHHLVNHWRVVPDEVVPLYFEKSKWTAVAMYGILKAGAAYAFIGLQEPPARIRSMLQTTRARLAISSSAQSKALVPYIPDVVTLSEDSMKALPGTSTPVWTDVTPNNAAYILFTSGSTGEPKAVLTEHRAGSTSAIEHGTVEGVEPYSRVLQFASYTFDVSTSETLTTLIRGGTVCIPSESDRLEHLAEVINRMNINHTFLTPTVVSLIAPNEVPNLEVLKLGGEALTRDNIAIWADKVKLSNSYGVAECAIRSVYRQDITPDTDFTDCGSAVGSCVWITNPDNFEELTPIGGTGELLIEGPTVARGYLGDPEKTRKAFVSPSWLNALFPGRKCRVYRTGDLVKYGVDGTIRFVGRSDSQIKIRGQRCELREIEHHLCVDPGVGLAATAVPSEGPYRGRLVAVIAFQDALTQDTQLTLCTSKHRSELAAKLAGLHEILTEKVPAYMVPTVWIPVTCLPINPSGKLNRISINRWLGSMNDGDQQVVSALSADQTPESDKSAASTLSETAEFLRTIWARVLNYPVDQIAPGTSFFRIGGDSISAMQVAALCRGHQIQITMQDVMHLKTLNRLATGCESRRAPKLDTATVNREKYNEPFLLSPIQSIFFDLMPDGTNGYSLGVCLRACTHVPANAIAEAIAFVTQRHSMLRARFQKHSGQWTQKILNPSATAHAFDTYRLPPTADYTNVLSATREKLDFTNGPVFAAAYIDRGENEQILFLTAHHLVVDVVSWRVIVQDLENSIRGAGQPSLTSMPFQAWLEKQRHQAVENRLASKKATLLPQPSPSYWGLMPQQNLSSDAIEQSFSLSERASAYIFAQASSGLRLDPVDILVGTLAFSFSRVFRDRLPITIDNEGHGREPWDPSIDLSSTVGWFSTRYPLRVDDRARESLSECIRCMRQLRRSSPDNGRQFFSEQCYCHPEEKAEMMSEMSFNYLGQSQPSETPDSLFENLGYRAGNDLSMRRFALIEMDAIAQDGRFTFTYEYPKGIKHRDRIQQWLSLFAQTLETLNAKLTTAPPEPTLSDFHLNLSSEDFESLITTVLPSAGIPSARYVEDMYRCSPTQQGIFLSQLQNPERYNVVSYFKVYPSPCDDTICLDRMEDAWRALVARHQILRTIIVSAMAEGQSLIQVVLDECRVRTAQFETSTESEAYETLKSKRPLISIYEQPLHALSMCTVDNAGYAIFKLEISHALIDAASNGVLFADLERAYSGQLVQDMNPAFSSYVAKIAETSEDDSLKYWKNYLSGTSPCIFPRLTHELSEHVTVNYLVPFSDHARLHDFCTRREITTATVYQLAWAMLLKAFIGTESVCFGFLASGRDMDIPGIHDSIGPYINMLVSRVELDLSLSIHETLQNLQQRTLQSLSNQFTSLSQICHALNLGGGQQLFNTVLSVQRGISTRGIEKADCTICDMEMSDPTEFDITVNVIDSHDQHTACLTVQQSTVPEWLAQHLAYTLSQILQSIIGQDHSNSVSDIQALSSQDKNQILSWNATNPAKVDRCTHDLVADQMILLPNALAVSAWDGDFTYAELDTLSAGYASALISRGVGPETFVPFCMEKTRWSVVAILSIMRAGGACVPLDPGHPRERIQAMVDQLSPPVVVVSEAQVQHCSGLTDGIVIMGDNCPMDPTVHSHELVDVKPSNACYVIFTSGSTGVPKGVVWNHSTLASSVVAHGLALKYEQRSRMLQFAAHVFDISVSEFITPLVYGKCVVIPSDENRMKDIEGFITERKVDWAFLTPTVARLIDPNLVPTLKTLVLGGESIGQDNVQKWSQRLQMMIIWGPCETCIYSACREVTDINTPAENFGSAIGSKHWIVDPTDSNQLQPIGAVGEIITEGPIVARGYHGKPIGADDGFVGPRSWSPWTGSSSNRYFKTGDLGRYNRDGSISFVARKDNQVKVRGQRMELQDVEHQLSRMPQVRHSTVTFPDAGPYAKQLVATVVLATDASSQEHGGTFSMLDPSERHIQSVHEIQDGLASSLPMYMVPTVWVMLQDLPRTVNGKLDRVRIKQWLNQVPDDVVEMVSRYMQADEADQPATEIEKKIQQTWADVLNLPHRYISNSSSFLRLGGDSIAAMTVLTRCRQLNVFVTVQDILRSKSLAQLAACATHYLEPTIEQQEELDTPFALSPMQKMHFNRTRNGIERFNQGFFLKLQRHVSLERVDEALQDIVMLHSALRTRFQKTESGHWSQYTPSHTEDNFALIEEYVSTQGECEGVASRVESQIDIVKGPIMAAALVNSKGQDHSQYLLISAHHLVVDLVSWRIILGDLEELLEKGKVNSHRSTSFQTWLSRHQQHVTEARTAVPTRGNCTPTDYAYWGLTEGENVYGDAKEESFALSHDQTATLLNKCHDAIGTEPIDILLTAVLFAFRQTFADRTEWPTVWNEGHGREPWDASMDLTRTVGWFTSIFPISVANDTPRDVISVLRRAKDARRAFSGSKGASYFAAQFAGDPNADESDLFRLPEIIFNYAGAYQQLEKEDGLFVNAGDINLHEVDMNLQRFSLFNVEMVVKNGQLHCTLVYHRRIKQVDQISDLLANCKLGLERQIEMLPTHPKLPTLSDFSSHDLRYEDLDYLVSRTLPELGVPGVADVEDYVPCSPMQNYMMNIERRIPGFINTYFYYEIIPGDGNRVDFSRLRRAWQTVVDRNPILRTIFVRNKDGERMQVILKHLPAPIERISGDTLAVLEDLNKSSPVPYEDNRVHYKVQYLETADGRGFCHLNISHALSDASSRPPLFEELSAAYDDRTRTSLPRSYVAAALEIESLHPYSFDFWKEYVANVPSCHLPVSVDRMQPPLAHQEIIVSTPPYADLLERCASEGVTMNNLLHAAWALLLRHATKNPKVCFNHLTAGRDARIPDIATVIGPCFNILLAKADIPASGSLGQVLHDAREDFLETLPHNGLPIAALEKGHSDHIEDMCNTSINFRKFVDQDEAKVLSPRQTEIRSIGQRGQVAHAASLDVEERREGLHLLFFYLTSQVSGQRAQSLARNLQRILHSLTFKPSQTVGCLMVTLEPTD